MKALIIVDIQNDFLPGGALAVNQGDKIIPIVNRLIPKFELVIATQDWHPANHGSFASNHAGKKPGESINLFGLNQILWPDHCVQNTFGASFSADLDTRSITRVFQKGTDQRVDSYSGFYDNGKKKDTGLSQFLKDRNVDEVYIVGLATDYCVKYTAIDAAELGFQTFVIADATRAVNLQKDDGEQALKEMLIKGISVIDSSSIIS
jgi:nicotinamidase/pyrazinamidase